MNYRTLFKKKSYGQFYFGLEIKAAVEGVQPDWKAEAISNAVYKAADKIEAEILAEVKKNDPRTKKAIDENKKILDLFENSIFVEEISNGYCSDWCCRHIPWFIVTTTVGRIKIGWRKRVIEIDWSETVNTKTAEELFPDDDVTKGDKFIHAWGYQKAKEYLDKIITKLN